MSILIYLAVKSVISNSACIDDHEVVLDRSMKIEETAVPEQMIDCRKREGVSEALECCRQKCHF